MAGTYQGAVTIKSPGSQPPTLTIPVSLTVTKNPVGLLTTAPASLNFNGSYRGATPPPQKILVTSQGVPANFTVSVELYEDVYNDNSNWLLVSANNGTTPAEITVSLDLTKVSVEGASGSVIFTGPENTVSVLVSVTFVGFQPYPSSLLFSAQTGSSAQRQTVNVDSGTVEPPGFAASASTSSGGPWLTVSTSSPGSSPVVYVIADSTWLSAGTYTGTVTLTAPGNPSAQFPVTFVVWGTAPPLSVTPSSLLFIAPMGGATPPAQNITVTSGGVPLPITVSAGTSSSPLTPTTVSVTNGAGSVLGYYQSSVQITAPTETVTVPVGVLVTTSSVAPPSISAVLNSASQTPGAVSPGEIITLDGFGAGPSYYAAFGLNPNGSVATYAGGARILFDGEPAPLIFATPYQTSAIVPYEVANRKSTSIQVEYDGVASLAWGVPVASAAPAIFTLDGSGIGRSSVLNQDNTINGPANPASHGTVIQVFATGEGQTSPPGVTGSVTGSNLKKPLLPVKLTIGGFDAQVLYAGSAPDAVAGLLQVNAIVPLAVLSGPALPISLSIGDLVSPTGTTIAVQ